MITLSVVAPGVKISLTPAGLQRLDVLVGDDAAPEDGDVRGTPLAQELDDAREEIVVRARENRQRHRVDVFLDRRRHDHLGGLVEPGVDDLEARVPERPGDDLRPAVVAVEADLSDEQSELAFLGHVTLDSRRRHRMETSR